MPRTLLPTRRGLTEIACSLRRRRLSTLRGWGAVRGDDARSGDRRLVVIRGVIECRRLQHGHRDASRTEFRADTEVGPGEASSDHRRSEVAAISEPYRPVEPAAVFVPAVGSDGHGIAGLDERQRVLVRCLAFRGGELGGVDAVAAARAPERDVEPEIEHDSHCVAIVDVGDQSRVRPEEGHGLGLFGTAPTTPPPASTASPIPSHSSVVTVPSERAVRYTATPAAAAPASALA